MASHAFRIGPLTHYADPDEMRAWLQGAAPKERLIYASGPALGQHAVASLAREWQASCLVHLFQPRSQTRANCFDYMMEKRPALDVHRPECGLPPAGSRWATSPDGRIYALLCEAADAKEPCPTNEMIAQTLSLPSRRFARYRFDKLVDAGLIKIIESHRFGSRVIEIVASSARTASNNEAAL